MQPKGRASSELYNSLNKRWKDTCKVLFLQEVGEIDAFLDWFTELNEPIIHRKSGVSGKDVAFAIDQYSEGSKWIGLEEIDYGKKFEPVGINDLKDIDSLVEAIGERIYYTGNVVLGNSDFVESSSNINDSFFMYETGRLGDCKYIAYSTLGRLCETCFGCNGIGESAYCLRCYETFRDKRCLELWMSQNCADCYYSFGLNNCSHCMFCFNLKDKSYAIGNLALGREKYAKISAKLLGEMAQELQRAKRLPSLPQIAIKSKDHSKELAKLLATKLQSARPEKLDRQPIEDAWMETAGIVLGKKLGGGIDAYSKWLSRHTRKTEKHKSAISGKEIFRWDYASYFQLPPKRLVTMEEAAAIGESVSISESEAEKFSFACAHDFLGKIAYFNPEYREGTNTNTIESPTCTRSSNAYRSTPVVYSKYCGYTFWPRSCECQFGCGAMFDSKFCINCYQSVKLTRCFECDSCRDCSDSLFLHNCENVNNSMFCFNAKNLSYAIGNAALSPDRFRAAKKSLLGQLSSELEKSKDLKADIYNIGARR